MVVAQVPPGDPATALDDLRAELDNLTAEFPAARLVVYPEYHTCRVHGNADERRRRYEAIAEPLNGPRVQELRDIAKAANIWLMPGTVAERGADRRIYNTALAITPDGDLAAAYRKIFPWRPFEPFTPGDRFVVFDLPGVGRIGMAVCYDLWFPEVARQLAWLGADLLVYQSQTSTSDWAQQLVLARATAIHNQVYVVSANAAAPPGTGRSVIVDPEGLVRAEAPSQSDAYITDVLDFNAVTRVRAHGTAGVNRMWCQFRPGDPVLHLPMYDGSFPSGPDPSVPPASDPWI